MRVIIPDERHPLLFEPNETIMTFIEACGLEPAVQLFTHARTRPPFIRPRGGSQTLGLIGRGSSRGPAFLARPFISTAA